MSKESESLKKFKWGVFTFCFTVIVASITLAKIFGPS